MRAAYPLIQFLPSSHAEDLAGWLADPSARRALPRGYVLRGPVLLRLAVEVLLRLVLVRRLLLVALGLLLLFLVVLVRLACARRGRARVVCGCVLVALF